MKEFWGKMINVSEEAARLQVKIINQIPAEKRFKIALDFANFGINQTRKWIKTNHPHFSEREVTLEFVRLMHYKQGKMSEEQWQFFQKRMQQKIRKEWAERFRQMMKDKDWNYEDVAKLVGFKNGKVVAATISRGLPAFAKLAVLIHEQSLNQ